LNSLGTLEQLVEFVLNLLVKLEVLLEFLFVGWLVFLGVELQSLDVVHVVSEDDSLFVLANPRCFRLVFDNRNLRPSIVNPVSYINGFEHVFLELRTDVGRLDIGK
jgi:hypothetical protein